MFFIRNTKPKKNIVFIKSIFYKQGNSYFLMALLILNTFLFDFNNSKHLINPTL